MAGTFELCVDVSNPCVPATENPIPQCMTVTVTDVMGDDPEPVVICSDDTYSYGGSQYPPGVHDVVLSTPEGCDSLVTLIVNSVPDQQTDLGYFYLCDGNSLNVGNTSLSCNNEGPQEVILSQSTYPFCDSILSFNILCLNVDAYVFDPPILEEGVDTVELDGGNSLADPPFFDLFRLVPGGYDQLAMGGWQQHLSGHWTGKVLSGLHDNFTGLHSDLLRYGLCRCG